MPANPKEQLPRLPGDLEAVRLLGKGGMGSVFEAVSRRTGARYAVKTLLKTSDEGARARFRREAELLARCDRHPGIVKVHSAGEGADGTPFLVLDLVRGEGLDALLDREGPLEPARAAALGRELARALAFVHGQGVIHRDVKPSNVLLDAEAGGAPRLTDFGLATARDVERLTLSGAFLGTVSYCAPEQVGNAPLGPSADVFSLGAVLFHALAGTTPFQGSDHLTTITRLLSEDAAPDVRTLAPEVPEPLARIVAHCLEKAPGGRYASGGELEADLGRFLAGEPVLARARRRSRRVAQRIALALGAVGAVAVLVALAVRFERRREVAALALTDSDDALGRARRTLARFRESAAIAPITSAGEASLSEAIADARLALGRARDAGAAGASRAAAAEDAAHAVLDEADVAAAGIEIATGRAAGALARLEAALPGTPDVQLAHARTLAALGRSEEARREATTWLDGTGEKTPERLESAADVLRTAGEPARARKIYTGLLPHAGRRTSELQAKRGAAAALAGDEREALADLRALVPDPLALSETRAANARLAPLAPVLYRRGLASPNELARDRDLEGAWRLASPPPELVSTVASAWFHPEAWDRLAAALFSKAIPSPGDLRAFRHEIELTRRGVLLDPDMQLERRWASTETLRAWADNNSAPEFLIQLSNELLPAWPESPGLNLLAALGRYHVNPSDMAVLPFVRAGIDGLVAVPRHDLPGVQSLAERFGEIGLVVGANHGYSDEATDWVRIRQASLIGDTPSIWLQLANAAVATGRLELAREAAGHVAKAANPGRGGDDDLGVATTWRRILEAELKFDEAVEVTRAFDRKRRSESSLDQLLHALDSAQRWDEIVQETKGREPLSTLATGTLERALQHERADGRAR